MKLFQKIMGWSIDAGIHIGLIFLVVPLVLILAFGSAFLKKWQEEVASHSK